MTARFLFSTKMQASNMKVLEALALAGRVTCASAIVVTTNLPVIAELLETLDTAEEITVLEPDAPKPKTKQPHRYNGGEKVECPQCHNQVSAMYMLKDGSKCKMCAIKAKRLAKSQAIEMSQTAKEPLSQPMHSALPPKAEHAQENRQEQLARPKETIRLAGLRGRKVG